MNRIYKSIWNYATRTFTAVSEIQQSRGKKTQSRQAAVALAAATALFSSMAGSTLAETIHWGNGSEGIGTEIDLSKGNGVGSFVIGSGSPAYNYGTDDVDIGNYTYTIIVDQPQSALDLDESQANLFDQSAGSSYQFIAAPSGITGWPSGLRAEDISLKVSDGSTDSFKQTIRQNNQNVATATYAIGDAAAALFRDHAGDNGLNGSLDREWSWSEWENVPVRVDLNGTKFDISTGINVNHSGGSDGDEYAADDGLSTLVVLKSLTLAKDQTLTLNAGANQKWFASLDGEGSIAYVGDGKNASSVDIRNVFDSLANTYAGKTDVSKITLNLYRENSFGSNALVTASDAVINTQSGSAFAFANSLDYHNIEHNFASGQTSFNVNNAQGEAAEFTGTNSFNASSSSAFAFTVAGDMNVGTPDQTGSTAFSNSGNGGIDLHVNGDLTVYAGSTVTGADKVTADGNLNLYNVGGIDADSTLTIGTALNFIDAEGTFAHNAEHNTNDGRFAVSLSNSNIVYDQGLTLAASGTTLKDESTLTASAQSYDVQLGESVDFLREPNEDRSQLIVTGENAVGGLNFGGIKLSGDGLTVLQGDGSTNIAFTEGLNLSDYAGWIRLENGTQTLTQDQANFINKSNSAGLSIGAGSAAKVAGEKTVNVNRFGWSTDSEGGVLDLTGFDFTDENTAALYVSNGLYFGQSNIVRVDLNSLTYNEDIRKGNIFTLNQSGGQQILVEGTWNSATGGSSNIVLQDSNGDQVEPNETTILKNLDHPNNNAAAVDWSLDAEYYNANDEKGSPAGIYLDYSVTSVELLNGRGESDPADPDAVLDKESALVAVGTKDSHDMTAKITGHGILELRYDDASSADSARTVTLNNNESDYTGATVVTGNVSLESTFKALGQSVLVLAGENSNYTLRPGSGADQGQNVEIKLQGIATGSGTHAVNLGDDGHMTIVGDGIAEADLAAIQKYDSAIQSGNVLGAGTKLVGEADSVFELSGTSLTAQSADVFNGYAGSVRLSGDNAALTIHGDKALTDGSFQSESAGSQASSSVITLDVDATISNNGADFSSYIGTINATENHTYTVAGTEGLDKLGISAIVADNASIVFSGISGNFANKVTLAADGAGSTWSLTNGSTVTLNSTSGEKSGIDHVEIDAGSSLTLVEADDAQTEGGLEKLADKAAFTGSGTLNLSGYELSSDDLNFAKDGATFAGTLGLQDKSKYTLLSSAGYAVSLEGGSTLAVGPAAEGNTLGLTGGKSLYVTGTGNVLDLTNAVANADGALFTAHSVEAKGEDAALTIQISEAQQTDAVKETNLLDQDEGGFGRLLVDAAAKGDQQPGLTVQVGDEVVAENSTVDVKIDDAGLVTGTYERTAGFEDDGDIALNYKLTALDVKADTASPVKEVIDLTPAGTTADNRDLNVKLTGDGVIGINGTVSVGYQAGSSFTGTFKADAEKDALTLSGSNAEGVTASADLSNGASLTVLDTQRMSVTANKANLNVGSADAAAKLELSGTENKIADTTVAGAEDSSIALLTDAEAEISGSLAYNLSHYAGTIALDAGSALTLKNTGATAYAIDRITSGNDASGSATLSLAEGGYIWNATHESYKGTVDLDGTLTLNGWTTGNTDFTGADSTTKLAGTGTLNVGGISASSASTVVIDADRITDFLGTAAVGSGSTLHVNADTTEGAAKDFFADGAKVELAADGTLEVANAVDNNSATFDTNVSVDGDTGGTFRVTQGSVTLAENIVIAADATDVVSGASLKVKGENLDKQIGENVTLGGTLRIEATDDLTLDSKTVVSESENQAGVIHVDLGATDNTLTIAESFIAKDFAGKLRLSNGTYTFSEDVPENGIHNFAVGAGGQFNVAGDKTVNLDSFAWEYVSPDQTGGVLDITEYANANGDPALTVGSLELNGSGSIRLDVSKWMQGLDATTGEGNILDLDERGHGNLVISVTDETWLDDATNGYLTLDDTSDADHVQKTDLKDDSNQTIAEATWNYGLGKNKDGVYIAYDVESIELKNANESLGALVLKADEGGDSTLSAAITGNGRISVESNVTISSEGNDFAGKVTVAAGKTLTTSGSYVLSGNAATPDKTVELVLKEGAGYVMTAVTTEGEQDQARLKLAAGENASVTLNRNELTLLDGSTFAEGAKVLDGEPSDTDWSKSTVIAEGAVTMQSAGSTLAASNVDWTVDDGGSYVMEGEAFTLAGISSADKTSAETGGTIVLNTDAAAGDLSEFVGTISVADGKTVSFDLAETATVKSVLNDQSLAVSLKDSTLDVNGSLKLAGLTTTADSVIDLGSLEIGAEAASGSLGFTEGNHPKLADGTTIRVAVDDKDGISESEVLGLDDGREAALVTGLAADQGALNLAATDAAGTALDDLSKLSADLKNAEGDKIGTATYGLSLVTSSTEDQTDVNAEFKLSALDLTGMLSLSTNEASTLDAVVNGTSEAGISIESSGITLAGENTYGILNVAEGASVSLAGTQTITGAGSLIKGTVSDAEAAGDSPMLVVDGKGASLAFGAAQSALENGVGLANGGTVVFDGVAPAGSSNKLIAGGFTVSEGDGTVALNNSTGTLSIDDLRTAEGASIRLALEEQSYLHLNGTTDITGSVSADVGESSALILETNAAEAAADWSNLTGTGALVLSATGEEKSAFTLGKLNSAFEGTIALDSFKVAFGGEANPNDALLNGKSSFYAHNAELTLEGATTVQTGMTADNSTLIFKEAGPVAQGGQSSSLITVAEGAALTLSGTETQIRIDADKLAFELGSSESGTAVTNEPLLNALQSASGDVDRYFQLVDGKVAGSAVLADMNGNALAETGSILVKDAEGGTVAELGFGATLVNGEAEGEDLWVGQAVREMRLHQSVELNADAAAPDESGVFNINVGITSAADDIDLTVAGDTPISLNRAGDISGTTTVEAGGTLILGADGALGVDDAEEGTTATDALIVHGTTALAQGVSQTVHGFTLSQSGALELGADSTLRVDAAGDVALDGAVTGDAASSVAFAQGAAVHVGTADKLAGMTGTWDLTQGASMAFDVAEGETEAMSAGTILGGTVVKTGAGALSLDFDAVSREGADQTAVEAEGGMLDVADWDGRTLSLKSLALGEGATLALGGNLSTAEGLTADGARIYVGDRNYSGGDFHNRTINGGFSGSATFVFNTELSQLDSLGDRLTINGVSTGSIDLEIINHSRLTSAEIDDLVLLRVEEIGAEGLAVEALDFDADGYEFRLAETEADGYTNWYLTSMIDEPDNPGTDPDPDEPDNPGTDPDPDNPGKPGTGGHVISSRVGALAGFASTVDMFDLSIHDRQGTRPWVNPLTGEKTETSMWIRQTVSHTRSGDSTGQLDSHATTAVTQIGGDILQATPSGGGYAFAGLMAGWGTSDYKTKSKVSGSDSRADTDGWTVGVYGGWHQNDPKVNRSGAYVNGWIQYSNFSSDVSWKGGDKMKARADGLSASLEAGWIIPALDFRADGGASRGHLYVEPHAQATWWGAEYDDVADADVSFYGKDNVTTRLGARFTVEMEGATTFSPYAEVNWVHNTEDYGARWGQGVSYVEGAGNQAEFKLGMEASFTKSFSGYAQFRGNWGDDGYNRREGAIGLKYRW